MSANICNPESGYWYLCSIYQKDTDKIITQRVLWRDSDKWYISHYEWHGNSYVYSQGDMRVTVKPVAKLLPEGDSDA